MHNDLYLFSGQSTSYWLKTVTYYYLNFIQPYASFVQSAKTVVFVSFGSVAEPKTMPAMWRNAFVELFE